MVVGFRNFVLKHARPLLIWLSKRDRSEKFYKINTSHYYSIRDSLTPGQVIVTATDNEITNLLIPGDWGHAGIYIGNGLVVEAVSQGVKVTRIVKFLSTKDSFALLMPKFASPGQMQVASRFANDQIGKPYDYYFRGDYEAFYCSELIYAAYHEALQYQSPFKRRMRWGSETVVPDDIINAKDKFSILYRS